MTRKKIEILTYDRSNNPFCCPYWATAHLSCNADGSIASFVSSDGAVMYAVGNVEFSEEGGGLHVSCPPQKFLSADKFLAADNLRDARKKPSIRVALKEGRINHRIARILWRA